MLSGYLAAEIGDYLINGLALNASVHTLHLNNFSFNKACIQAWTLCFAVNMGVSEVYGEASVTMV